MNSHSDQHAAVLYNNLITREQAIDTVRRWWHYWLMARNLKEQGEITRCQFYYVPYWKIEASIHGSVDGSVTECDSTGYGTYSVKKWVKGNIIYTTVATDCPEITIGYLKSDWSYGPLCSKPPLSALPVMLSKTDAVSKSIRAMEDYAVQLTQIEEDVHTSIAVNAGEITLVYYPLWVLQYSYSGKQYSVTVDGITGEVVAGQAPGDILLQAVSHVIALSLKLFLLTLFIWLFFLNGYSDLTCLLSLVIVAMAILVIKKTSDYSRYGSEVSQGYRKIAYGPLYDKDQSGREILFNDLKVSKRPID